MIFPVLMGLVGCGVLLSLGVWQLHRMEWKAAGLAEMDARIGGTPEPRPAVLDPVADKFRPVTTEGRFTGRFLEVLAGQKGSSPGVRIIEAFDTTDGRHILIDRGFIEDEARPLPRPPHEAAITGNLHWPDDSDSFTPPPDPKTGLWFAREVAAMAAKLGTEPTFIVAREPTGDGIAPMPVDTSAIPNDHWGYAITWFSLATVWAVMTGFLLWRIRRQTA